MQTLRYREKKRGYLSRSLSMTFLFSNVRDKKEENQGMKNSNVHPKEMRRGKKGMTVSSQKLDTRERKVDVFFSNKDDDH